MLITDPKRKKNPPAGTQSLGKINWGILVFNIKLSFFMWRQILYNFKGSSRGNITCGTEINRIELAAHHCQSFLRKVSVQRAYFKALRILLTKNYIFLLNLKKANIKYITAESNSNKFTLGSRVPCENT